MIDTNHLQILKDQEEINRTYLESVQEIENIISPVKIAEMRRNQEMELGIFTESSDEAYMEGVKEAITKLGNKIIEIAKRIKEFIKSIPDRLREATWNKADVDKRMSMIKKEDPKKFEALKVYVDKGMVDFNTFDSMKKFYDGYDELIDELKKKETDEKSLKGKLEKIKKGINNNADTIKNVAAGLGIAATAGTIAYNYMRFRNEGDKYAENQAGKIADASYKRSKELEKLADIIDEKVGDEITGESKKSIIAQALVELEKETKMNVSKITRFRAFMWKKFDKLSSTFKPAPKDLNDAIHKGIIDAANQSKISDELRSESERLKNVSSYNRQLHNTQSNRQRPIR